MGILPLTAAEADTSSKAPSLLPVAGWQTRHSGVFCGSDFPSNQLLSAHARVGFRFSPETKMGALNPYAIQGIGVAVNTFFNGKEVGTPIAFYVFQSARIAALTDFQSARIAALTERVSLDYEWNFGLSGGWKPYDRQTNPANTTVGSPWNAYINLGLYLNWDLNPGLTLQTGAVFSHFSNGNTRYPNSGVNAAGLSVGLLWDLQHAQDPAAVRRARELADRSEPFRRHLTWDLVLYGAVRKKGIMINDEDALLVPGSFGIAGLNINPLYHLNRHFAAGLSLDAQYDESANIQDHIAGTNLYTKEIVFFRPPFKEQFSVGVSVRAELSMPIFSINAGIGRNFYCCGHDTDSFYQILALKAHVSRHFFLHIGYQVFRFKNPNNLMLGIGARF